MRTSLYEADINCVDYNYFIYDNKINTFAGYKLQTKLSEKNEYFWTKYDLLLNDLQMNLKLINFKNEMNFIIVDRLEDNLKKKRRMNYKGKDSLLINSTNSFMQNSNMSFYHKSLTLKEDFKLHSSNSSPKSIIKPYNKTENINYFKTDIPNNNIGINEISDDILTYKERIKSLVIGIENYLSKYPKFKDKFSDKISCKCSIIDNKTFFSFVHLQNNIDWLLITCNEYFNEKNALFVSIKWLSCNSFSIHNFYKDLSKKCRSKNLGLVKIPCDDIIYSNFKRVSSWKFPYLNRAKIFDRMLNDSICCNFIRSEIDNNFIYFSEETNILIKLSQKEKGMIFLYDAVMEKELCETEKSYFLEFSIQLDTYIDLFNYMTNLIDRVEKLVKN